MQLLKKKIALRKNSFPRIFSAVVCVRLSAQSLKSFFIDDISLIFITATDLLLIAISVHLMLSMAS